MFGGFQLPSQCSALWSSDPQSLRNSSKAAVLGLLLAWPLEAALPHLRLHRIPEAFEQHRAEPRGLYGLGTSPLRQRLRERSGWGAGLGARWLVFWFWCFIGCFSGFSGVVVGFPLVLLILKGVFYLASWKVWAAYGGIAIPSRRR